MCFFLLGILISLNVQAGEWWTTPRSEDDAYLYYVSVSEGEEGVTQLQDKAFNKAMGELIREHFGMSIQINESAVEELQKESFQVVTKQSSAPLFIKGIGVTRTHEKELDHGQRVYVQIRVDKKALKESIQQHLINPGEDSLNTYGDSNVSKINFKVKTNPQGALIHFSHLDQRFSIQGQGDALFYLPRGRYKMVVSAPGYSTVIREILAQSQGIEEKVTLEELFADLELNLSPEDATIELQGKIMSARKIKLKIGKTYKFKFSHPDYLTQEIEFLSQEQERLHHSVTLSPKSSSLFYEVMPKGAKFEIDGQEVNPDHGKIEILPGNKKVIISYDGYANYKEEIEVAANRDYPLKVIQLKKEEAKAEYVNHGSYLSKFHWPTYTYRLEVNPFTTYDHTGYLMLAPIAVHLEYDYISFGIGYSWTELLSGDKDWEGQDTENPNVKVEDIYGTVRLITPQMGAIKLFASGTYGEYSTTTTTRYRDKNGVISERKPVKARMLYEGVGGGLRMYMNPQWSIHAEYIRINAKNCETKRTETGDRILIGLSFEF